MPNRDSKPKLIIFAGANGSGKTTAAQFLLPRLRIKEFVNADEIARGLSPLNPAGQALAAGRLVIKRTDEMIAKGESFAIETTLSGHHVEKIIARARQAGYRIEMHYIFCSDININLKRIKNRVKQGGHHVPAADVRRRYWRSLRNFWTIYQCLCDIITVYDTTSGNAAELFEWAEGPVVKVYDMVLGERFFTKVFEAVKNEH